ncbi:MAG: class I SAM-dependent methyltransferase [Kineosporiaceae bacterium]|nr:class I SAM-dependent methyltransferase [Aeromicrobium sp.]
MTIPAPPARGKGGASSRGFGPAGIPGRWLRVIPSSDIPSFDEAAEATDREVSDPNEAMAVRAGWQLVDAYERLSVAAARLVFGREVEAWRNYTDQTIINLVSKTGHGSAHESANNRLRYRRMMDFARKGDRVFDVGFGRGFLAAQLIKGSGIACYHGIDIVDEYIPSATTLFANNGLADAPITLAKGDLYDLTREKVESTGADLVICCEVLEHVPDAELALKTLSDSLPVGAELIFSVPLVGRLEGVWGHVSVFGVARLKQMLEAADLYAHHVEPLSNVWALVVASRDPAPSQRVSAATHRPPVRVEVPLSTSFDFLNVRAEEFRVGDNPDNIVSLDQAGEERVRCQFAGSGSVAFSVPGLESLRLSLDFLDEVKGLERIRVISHSKGVRTCEWEWTPKEPPAGQVAIKLRPGETDSRFISGPHKNVRSSDEVSIAVTLREGGSAVIGFRASVLP